MKKEDWAREKDALRGTAVLSLLIGSLVTFLLMQDLSPKTMPVHAIIIIVLGSLLGAALLAIGVAEMMWAGVDRKHFSDDDRSRG